MTPEIVERTLSTSLKAIILDCDGVILESVEIKTRAFRSLFQGYPAHLDRIIQLHRDNTGLSRYDKFQIIYRDYLRQPLSEAEIARLDHAFSDLVFREVLTCPFVPGAEEFLVEAGKQWPLFLVSGTPHEELCQVVRERGLARYFRQIYGSPRRKERLLRDIARAYAWDARDLIFIGDSLVDRQAAQAVGIHFVGRVREGTATPFPESVRWIVSNLKELAARWNTIVEEIGSDLRSSALSPDA